MNNLHKGKIIFWAIFIGVVGLLIGDKGGGGYEKLLWAAGGVLLGVFIGIFFSRSKNKNPPS